MNKIHLVIEQDATGVFFATSPDVRGFLCARQTMADLFAIIPVALAELKAAADEIDTPIVEDRIPEGLPK